jgi:hypothetical protein
VRIISYSWFVNDFQMTMIRSVKWNNEVRCPGRKWLPPVSKRCFTICLDGLRKTKKTLSQDCRFPNRPSQCRPIREVMTPSLSLEINSPDREHRSFRQCPSENSRIAPKNIAQSKELRKLQEFGLSSSLKPIFSVCWSSVCSVSFLVGERACLWKEMY